MEFEEAGIEFGPCSRAERSRQINVLYEWKAVDYWLRMLYKGFVTSIGLGNP